MKNKNFLKKLAAVTLGFVMTLGVGAAGYAGVASEVRADSYTITFKTGSGDGTSASTSTACSTVVSDGSDYLSGNLVTATKVYYSGGSGLKLGASSNAGTIKMNLSDSGKVTATSVVVNAKLYNSSKATTLKVNGSSTQNLKSDFADFTFDLNSNITYLELVSSKYCWIKSVVVNYSGAQDKTLTYLRIANEGSVKKSYSAGESFDPSGLVVYASWDDVEDTSNNVVSDVVWSPEPLTSETTSVTGYHKDDKDNEFAITVNNISVVSPDYSLTYTNKPFSKATNTGTDSEQVDVDGITYENVGGLYYSSENVLEFYKSTVPSYLANIDSYGKYISKIIIKNVVQGSKVVMYEGASAKSEGSLVEPVVKDTTYTYNFSGENEYFTLKQTTSSSNYFKFTDIDIYLGNALPKYATSVEIYSSDFTITNKIISLSKGESGSEAYGQLNATVLPADADDRDVTWESSDENIAYIDEDTGYVVIETGTATTCTITAYANGAEELLEVYDTITVEIIDTSAPVLTSVTVGGTLVTPQYAGKTFNYNGLTFTPVYDRDVEEGTEDEIDPSQLDWGVLQTGVSPSATYTSENYSGTVTITISNLTPIDDYVTDIKICGSLSKTSYYTNESWSPEGLHVEGLYASDQSSWETINSGITYEYDPEKPALDVESVSVTASYLELESDPVEFDVEVTEKSYLGGLTNGRFFLIVGGHVLKASTFANKGADSSTIEYDGETTINSLSESDAWYFKSTGTDNQWTIRTSDASDASYLYSIANNNGLVSGDTSDSWTVSQGTSGTYQDKLLLKDSLQNRYISYTSSAKSYIRTYTNTDNGNCEVLFVKYEAPATYDSLTVTATKTSGWEVGDSPSLTDLGATVKAVYSSGDKKDVTSSATITNNPYSLAKGDNTVTISYTDSKLSTTHTTSLTVNAVQSVTGLTMGTYSGQMYFEGTQELSVTITPDDANNKTISWETSNSSIATVSVNATDSSKATVTAGTIEGDVTITAKSTDGSNKSVSASIHVNDPTVHVTGISISGTATKTEYYAGSSFDPAGLSVTTMVSSGTGTNVINDVIWSPNPLTDGTTEVTASYTCDDGTFTDTLSGITVCTKTLQSIEIVSEPIKTEYHQGDSALDLTGLSVTAHYQLDDVEDISGYTTSGYDLSVRGDQTVTVTYGGKTDTFDIHVSIPELKVSYTTEGNPGYFAVTDLNDLAAGDKVVFSAIKNDGTVVVPTAWVYNSNNYLYYLDCDAASVNSSTGELTANSMLPFTLSKDGENWKFTDKDNYVLGASAAKAFQKSSGTQTWSITIEDGTTTVSSTTTGYGAIKYNPGSPRFLNYTSGQTDITLYKYQNATSTEEFTVSEKLYDAVVSANNCFSLDAQGHISYASGKSWADVAAAFSGVETDQLNKIKTAISDAEGNVVETFLTKYDEAVSNNSVSNFLQRSVEIAKYTVTLNSDPNVLFDAVQIERGSELDLSEYSPEKTGYSLSGWKDENNTPYGINDKITITGDITLTAQWSAGRYTLSYQTNGGTLVPDSGTPAGTYDYQTTINLPSVTKNLYKLEGWYKTSTFDSDSKITSSFQIAQNTTLFAKWEFDGQSQLNQVSTSVSMSFKYTYNDNPVVSATKAADEKKEYALVTDASTLQAGDKILIVGVEDNNYYALAPYSTGNNCKRNDIAAPSSGRISTTVASLTLGGSAGAWTLYDGTYYLYAAGGTGSNYLKGANNADADTAKWTISCDNSGVATIKCVDTATTKNWLRHNTGSDLFSCYASGQADIQIYKESAPSPYQDVNFRFNIKNTGLDALASNLDNGEDYGIAVTYDDGSGSRTRFFSYKPVENKYYIYEDGKDRVEFTPNLAKGYFTLGLGDVINNKNRAETVFTIRAYVDDGVNNPYFSTQSISYSVKTLIKEYYESQEYGSNAQVKELYNIFYPKAD